MYFAVIYRPGPKWLVGKTVWEQPLREHFHYMQQLFEQGRLLMGGPFSDQEGEVRALAVLKAASLAEAAAIVGADPVLLTGIATIELHPWEVLLGGPQSEQS